MRTLLASFAFFLLILNATSADENQENYDNATNYFNFQEYELAIAEYQKITTSKAEAALKAKASFYLGESYFRLKKYSKAKESFKSYLIDHPTHSRRPEGQFRISECFYFLNDFASAAKAYQRYVKENPDHKFVPLALYTGSGAFVETGNFNEALSGYKTLTEKYPKHELAESTWYNIGWVYFKSNQFEQAAKSFISFAEAYPESKYLAEAYLRAADAEFRNKNFNVSLKHYNMVLARGQGAFKGEAHQGIAWSYYKMKQYKKAANAFMTLGRNLPNADKKAESFYQAIQSYYSAEDFPDGIKAASELITTCKDSTFVGDALYWKGLFHRKQSQFEEASADLIEALKKGKTKVSTGEIKMELGNVYLNLKKYDDAVKVLQEAANEEKKTRVLNQIYYDLSKALHQQGNTDEALKVVGRIDTAKGADKELKELATFSKAEFEFSRKNYSSAIPYYDMVRKTSTSKDLINDAIYRIGWSYKFLKEPQKAIDAFQVMDLNDKSNRYGREVLFLLGGLYEDLKNHEQAKKKYEQLIALPGDYSADSYLALAEMQFKIKAYEPAIATLQKFLNKFTTHELLPDGRYLLAEVAYEAGNIDLALQSYNQIVDSGDENFLEASLYGRAWIYYDYKKFKEALNDLNQLLEHFPASSYKSSVIQLQGKLYLALNDQEKAKEVFATALKSNDKNLDNESILINLANVEADSENFEKALSLYDQFLNSYPNSQKVGRVLYDKGWLLMRLNKTVEAGKIFNQYKALYPSGELISDVEFALGELAYDKGQFNQALDHYAACSTDSRYKDKSLYKSGWCHFKKENYSRSGQMFHTLVTTCPESPLKLESMYRVGLSHLKNSNFAEASKAFNAFLNVASGDVFFGEALFNSAKVEEKLNNTPAAREKYEQYIKQFSDGEYRMNAEFRLAQILLANKEYSQARKHYLEVLKDKTHYLSVQSQFGVGETHYQSQAYNEAIKAYLKTLLYKDGEQWQATSLYRIALAHKNMRRNEKAVKYLKKLLQDFPASDEAKLASTELQKLKG